MYYNMIPESKGQKSDAGLLEDFIEKEKNMQYRKDKKGNDISLLGFGCMRFEGGGIGDYFQKANDQVMEAIRQGINYFDTAYVYKNNEKVLGRILTENKCRDQIYIATKLPQYMVRSISQAEKIFNQELELLQTEHVDYYLMHMLNDVASWERLKAMGIESWIQGEDCQWKN